MLSLTVVLRVLGKVRLNTSTNIIVQSTINSDVYTTSEVYQRWVKVLYT